jgi:carboxymethylenebutenolidase
MPGMCHDTDGRPPITPIAGGALDARSVTLASADGTAFRGYRARPADPSHAAVLILPDVRGLHPFYEELAQRFAEHGFDALAVDWFGRTAGVESREPDWDFMPHVERATWDGLQADVRGAVTALRDEMGDDLQAVFTVGFCFGGRASFLSATLGLALAGVVGFYGSLAEKGRAGMPAPASVADRMESPVLGLFGGADPGIPASDVEAFDRALEQAGVAHQTITYPGAPHAFFDRKAADFREEAEAAWDEVLTFLRERGAQIGA